MADERQTCPRRMGELGPWDRSEGLDTWRPERNDVRSCSFCGSLHPDDFMRLATSGVELGPTDKDYKVYVDVPEQHPEELRVISAITFDPPEDQRDRWQPADPIVLARDGWRCGDYRWMQLSQRGPHAFGKFYFQHLTEEQRRAFIDLLNTKQLNIGMPGHFYRLPFFCVRTNAGEKEA